jgi:hypothetical protein
MGAGLRTRPLTHSDIQIPDIHTRLTLPGFVVDTAILPFHPSYSPPLAGFYAQPTGDSLKNGGLR